jgi:hypothetical protein
LLGAEQHGVHDPPWDEGEQPGDDKRAGENQDHDAAVIGDAVTVRNPCPDWKHDQREDRQQMNRALRTYQPDLVDPERTDRDRYHQGYPDPAQRAMGQGPLRRGQLHDAKQEGGHGREGVERDRGSCIE